MVNQNLINVWKRQGMNEAEINNKIKSHRLQTNEPVTTPPLKLNKQNKRYSIRVFRPSSEIENYLTNLSKGSVSKFINESLREAIQKQNLLI